MGCSNSKVDVQPRTSSSEAWSNKPTSASKKGRPNSNLVRVKAKTTADSDVTRDHPSETTIIVRKDSERKEDVLAGNRDISSATSKMSTHTYDSGLEADYAHVITETCDPNLVKTIEEETRPPTPEFFVTGKQVEPRKRSGGKRRNQESADILAELQSQGIVTRPASRFGGGLAFEVNLDSGDDLKKIQRPPPRLAKLKIKKKKSKKTKEEIEAKMHAAEERRKKKEADMIERLNTSKKEMQVHTALDESERSQKKQVEVKLSNALDKAAENRKARMEALKEKLKQKQRHAEKVRQAKIERMKEEKHESEITSDV